MHKQLKCIFLFQRVTKIYWEIWASYYLENQVIILLKQYCFCLVDDNEDEIVYTVLNKTFGDSVIYLSDCQNNNLKENIDNQEDLEEQANHSQGLVKDIDSELD